MHSKVMPRTNISKAYYQYLVNDIEHDPLVKRTTLMAVCFLSAISIFAGSLAWFARTHPGNLVRTSATVSYLSSGRTDNIGSVSTFATFNFETKDGVVYRVRQQVENQQLALNQKITVGYSPLNPAYARILTDNSLPVISFSLWVLPFAMMAGLMILALFRHHKRQVEIWQAAEAANVSE